MSIFNSFPLSFYKLYFPSTFFFSLLIFIQRAQNYSVLVPTLSVRCTIDAAHQFSVDGWAL